MNVQRVIAGIGLLIFVFLLLNNGKQTISVIESLSSGAISGIRTLQGRT